MKKIDELILDQQQSIMSELVNGYSYEIKKPWKRIFKDMNRHWSKQQIQIELEEFVLRQLSKKLLFGLNVFIYNKEYGKIILYRDDEYIKRPLRTTDYRIFLFKNDY